MERGGGGEILGRGRERGWRAGERERYWGGRGRRGELQEELQPRSNASMMYECSRTGVAVMYTVKVENIVWKNILRI